jgi:hypothetical protein
LNVARILGRRGENRGGFAVGEAGTMAVPHLGNLRLTKSIHAPPVRNQQWSRSPDHGPIPQESWAFAALFI